MGDRVDYVASNEKRLSLLVDIVLVFVSFYLTYWMTSVVLGHPLFRVGGTTYYQTRIYIFLSWIISLLIVGEYPTRRLTRASRDMLVSLQVSTMGVIVFTSFSFVLKLHSFSRLFLGSYFVFTTMLFLLVRILTRVVLALIRRSGADIRTRIIVGDQALSLSYIRATQSYRGTGIRVIGYVGDTVSPVSIPYLGHIEDLATVLKQHPVDGVVLAMGLSDTRLERIIQTCEVLGCPLELMLDSLGSRLTSSHIVHTMGIPRMVMFHTPQSYRAATWKRITDIVCSVTLLILVSPVLVAIMIAIKLDDGGPVFFAQNRSGLHGKLFRMHKFRSMRVDAEEIREKLLHLNQMSGPVFKIQNDPRVTRIGRFLRKTSLDELPQLYDVLVGKMSLVGPRPPLPSEVNAYNPEHVRRLSVKPGITCLWQVGGRNEIDFEDWMQLDLRYIDNWSYWTDWKILFQTIPAVLKRKGAS